MSIWGELATGATRWGLTVGKDLGERVFSRTSAKVAGAAVITDIALTPNITGHAPFSVGWLTTSVGLSQGAVAGGLAKGTAEGVAQGLGLGSVSGFAKDNTIVVVVGGLLLAFLLFRR